MRYLPLMVLLAAALSAKPFWSPVLAQEPPEKPGAPTAPENGPDHCARAVLLIVGDPSMFALDSTTARLLIPAVVTRSRDGKQEVYKITFSVLPGRRAGSTIGLLDVSLEINPMSPSEDIGRGEATKVLAAAQQRLQALLLEIHEVSLESLTNQIQRAGLRKERATCTVNEQTATLQSLHEAAREKGEPLQPPDAQLYAAVKRDDLSLRAELAGLIARREAIVEHIAEAKLKLNASEKEQRLVLEEFAQVVQLREKQCARMRDLVKSAAASETDLQKVEVELVQARAELAERRRLFGQHSASTQLAQLNQQLVDVQIEIPATEARLNETREALNELGELARSSLGIQYERTRQALQNAFEEEQSAAVELARVTRERNAIPAPRIVVLRRGIEPK